jgi:hypothetical protein
MSISVGLDELAARIAERRGGAFLVTVGAGGTAHVASVRPEWQGECLVVPSGRTSRANVDVHPAVTLLWPGDADDEYALLVDGPADATPDGLTVRPASAVLHRRA